MGELGGFLMQDSVFSAMGSYLGSLLRSTRSVVSSCMTVLPYVFRLGELHKEVTEGYPDPISSKTADDLPLRSRGLLFNDIDRCTGCRECAEVCPARCIRVEEEVAHINKIWVSVFDIDFSQCLFCGLCVSVCHPNSLVHTRQYEAAAYEVKDLVASFGRGYVTEEQKSKWAMLRQLSETQGG